MKKKTLKTKKAVHVKTKTRGLASLITEVRSLIQSARQHVASVVDTFQVMTNFEIGRRIVEHEQKGAKRAGYGDLLLNGLAQRLTTEFGRGYSTTNLKLMRQFYLLYRERIGQTPTGDSPRMAIGQSATDQFGGSSIGQSATDQFGGSSIGQSATDQLTISKTMSKKPTKMNQPHPFTLSWTHYVCLLSINNSDERSFYEIEARQGDWSVSELKR